MVLSLFRSRGRNSVTISRPDRSASASRWASAKDPDVQRPVRHKVRVTAIQAESPDAVTVSIGAVNRQQIDFRAGQYLTHCFEIDGHSHRRAYSMSVPEGSATLAFTCKRVADGLVSNFIHDRLQLGDEYEILGPSGAFMLPPNGAPALVFVAGGSGITPVISLIETALARDSGQQIKLLYASRDKAGMIFERRLAALAACHSSLQLTAVLSQPEPDWAGLAGRLDPSTIASLAKADGPAAYYVCGPTGLMDMAAEGLQAAGIDPGAIRRESFVSASHASVHRPTQPQPIVLRRSGERIVQQPGQSILDAVLAAGVAHDFSCTVGGCGACKIKVLDGPVTLDEPNCLTADERDLGFTLACSAFATGPLEVDA